jgi:hypothetical protein
MLGLIYHESGFPSRKKPPVGPLFGKVTAQTMPAAPFSTGRPPDPPISVATHPGHTALTRIRDDFSPFANMRVRALIITALRRKDRLFLCRRITTARPRVYFSVAYGGHLYSYFTKFLGFHFLFRDISQSVSLTEVGGDPDRDVAHHVDGLREKC